MDRVTEGRSWQLQNVPGPRQVFHILCLLCVGIYVALMQDTFSWNFNLVDSSNIIKPLKIWNLDV